MEVQILLNSHWYRVSVSKYYHPVLLLDMRSFRIQCQMTNRIQIKADNPRTNISYLSAVFQFFFHDWPSQSYMGQVVSRYSVMYCDKNVMDVDQFPCILFLSSLQLDEILMYLPPRPMMFLKEIRLRNIALLKGFCVICLEQNTDVVNVHQDNYHHEMCKDCLLQYPNSQCPICRRKMEILYS